MTQYRDSRKIWLLFTMDSDPEPVPSKAVGVTQAQHRQESNKRPKRIGRGIYQLDRYFIATAAAREHHGWGKGRA